MDMAKPDMTKMRRADRAISREDALAVIDRCAYGTLSLIAKMCIRDRLTTVAPTISFGMPEASAIHDAASTKKSPPLMMSTRPTMSSKTVIAISICKFPFFTLSERFRFLLPQDYAEKDIISIIAGNRGKIQSYLPFLSNFTVLFVGPKACLLYTS